MSNIESCSREWKNTLRSEKLSKIMEDRVFFFCLRHELPSFLHGHAHPLDVGVLLLVNPLQHLVLSIDVVPHVISHVPQVGDKRAHLDNNVFKNSLENWSFDCDYRVSSIPYPCFLFLV